MLTDNKQQHFGIIKFYNTEKGFGMVQNNEFGNVRLYKANLKNINNESLLSQNLLVTFELRQDKQERYFAQNISLDYLSFVINSFSRLDEKEIHIILSYANDVTKAKLQELIYKKNNPITEEILAPQPIEETNNLDFLDRVLKSNSKEFNSNLIKTLAEGLGSIKNENTFQSVKQLSAYNNQVEEKYFTNFPYFIYQNSTKHFKFKLWLENIINFCDLDIIRTKFLSADETLKNDILIRCNAGERGFWVNNIEELKITNEIEEVYFDGIRDIILQEINQAKESILVAVAWFTNHHFLDALCEKVKQGVNVEIIILNDYINNWIEGLDFQKFINLGKEKGNSKFYFCGADNIMHHKFCIIDNATLFNGSYNWTYYAEHRNFENCMLFKNKSILTNRFIAEFNNLKNKVVLVETIIPIDRENITTDLFSVRQYRSKDLEYQAKEVRKTNIGVASRLIRLSLQINPENEEALKFQKQVENTNETVIRNQAIDNTLQQKQREQADLQNQIDKQKEQARIKEQEVKEKTEKEQKEKAEEQRKYNEKLAKQEAEKLKLVKQEAELKAKKDLELNEKNHLIEIERQKRDLEEQQIKEKVKREAEQKEAEQKRIAEYNRQEQEKKQQAQILAQKQAEQEKIKEETELLAVSKNTVLQGQRGKLRINLEWKTFDDLDLHVYDPDKNQIYYGSKQFSCQNSIGQLDVDANAGSQRTQNPQENIFWDKEAPEGTYSVEVNHYKKNEFSTDLYGRPRNTNRIFNHSGRN